MAAKKLSVARIRRFAEFVEFLKDHCPPPGERATVVFHGTDDPLEMKVAVGLGYSSFEIERILGWERDHTVSRELMFKPEYLQYYIDMHECSEESALYNLMRQVASEWWDYPVMDFKIDFYSPEGILLQLQRQEAPSYELYWDQALDLVKAFAEQSPNLEVARRRWAAVGEVGLLTREAQEKYPNSELTWVVSWLPARQCLRLTLRSSAELSALKVLDIP